MAKVLDTTTAAEARLVVTVTARTVTKDLDHSSPAAFQSLYQPSPASLRLVQK